MEKDKIVRCDVTQGIPLPDRSVHCVITSPPYWGLRDYGVAGQLGLEKTPEEYIERMVGVFRHVWRVLRDDGMCWLNMGDSYAQSGGKQAGKDEVESALKRAKDRDYNVSAWGFSERATQGINRAANTAVSGLKPKDLCMMPARLAIALQADGWYLRSDIIWAKPNPMPESVTDRPTKSHEHLFLLTKSGNPLFWTNNRTGAGVRTQPRGTQGVENHDWEWVEHSACKGVGCDNKRCVSGMVKTSFWQGHDYFYDADAVREPHADPERGKDESSESLTPHNAPKESMAIRWTAETRQYNPAGRNKRDVWTIPTQSFPEAHFATFPEKLVEPCIKAGTSEKGCCPECGSPWVKIVEKGELQPSTHDAHENTGENFRPNGDDQWSARRGEHKPGYSFKTTTIGWKPTCEHGLDPIPCTVYDPFMGSGTVGLVAYKLNRHYIGTELSAEYIKMAEKRLVQEKDIYSLFE